ncbi:phosphomannomutase [Microvirga pakistanensis]|uniref:phosphomannomutase n=1 Tax=Microvirga pakistanensis TaxID=1682650 RepID=UPI0010694EA0|nr:phosphomannomutase [Microvirga pakistanensis]
MINADTHQADATGASSLKFGTSGLRGLVTELNGVPAYAYTRAFAEMLKEDGAAAGMNRTVLVGRDLRGSSPSIARLCCAALDDAELAPEDCGPLPTPALAYQAMRCGVPAVMVTGSHIPEDRNGLKFYRTEGEIDKQDETRILALHARLNVRGMPDSGQGFQGVTPGKDPIAAYKARYLEYFGAWSLSGLTIGVYQHSSVARDLLVEVLEALGARTVPLGRATSFIPVDTEALREEDELLMQQWAGEQALDAIVSTDGDADRPLIADGTGAFLRGDLVGAITARYLGADALVTPVTSNSALEESGLFRRVIRTKVGSPYVIEGMSEAKRSGAQVVVGFEANGGVLLGSDVERDGRCLTALPTRDAMLPILCVLSEMAVRAQPLADIAADLSFKVAMSNRLKNVASERAGFLLSRLQQDIAFRRDLFAPLGGVAGLDARDGLRITANNGEVVHFRASGNAPELRVYVEASSSSRAESLLNWGLSVAAHQIGS